MFSHNEQPIKFFRIAESGNIAVAVIGVNSGVLIGACFVIINKAMIRNIKRSTIARCESCRVFLVHAVNPSPNVTPNVFFTTIGNNVVTVDIGNRTGSVTQIHGCPGDLCHGSAAIICFVDNAVANRFLHIERSVFNQHQKLRSGDCCGICLFPTFTPLLCQLSGVRPCQILR